jgi:excisionase family DNA binding protein
MASETTLPHLMKLLEVADTLNVSPHTIRAWVREGRIQPIRLCRRHMLAMPRTLVPVRLGAGRPEFASRLAQQPFGCGYIIRGLLNGSLPIRLTS